MFSLPSVMLTHEMWPYPRNPAGADDERIDQATVRIRRANDPEKNARIVHACRQQRVAHTIC